MSDNEPSKPAASERTTDDSPNLWENDFTATPESAKEATTKSDSVDDILRTYGYQVAADIPNVAAIGGAMASVLLGVLSMAGAWLTPWSMVNAIMGIAFGVWGFASPRKGLALAGILTSLLGILWNLWLTANRTLGT